MKIGLNMLYLVPGLTGGIETYARGLLRALDQYAPAEDEFVAFMPKRAAETLEKLSDRVRLVTVDLPLEVRLLKNLYEQFIFPRSGGMQKLDLLHSLAYVGPILTPLPHVLTVPDLNFKFPGHAVKGMKRAMLEFLSRNMARRSERVIAISDFTKREIEKFWPEVAPKTTVIHLGSDICSSPPNSQPRVDFLLFIGGGSHKNSPLAVRAFGKTDMKVTWNLTLVGRIDDGLAAEIARLPPIKRKLVRPVGFQPREVLDKMIACAGCVIVPSRYEGFGLPVIEAQVRGAPVICSTSASLPEIAGNGALLFHPDDQERLIKLMNQIATSPALCSELTFKGYENASRFSWAQTAKQTVEVYRTILQGGGRV